MTARMYHYPGTNLLASFMGNAYCVDVQSSLLKYFLRRTALGFLLASYTLIDLPGRSEPWDAIIHQSHQLHGASRNNPSVPLDSRPYWTQQKHAPAVSRISALALALPVSQQLIPPLLLLLVVVVLVSEPPYRQLLSPRSPRAPPCR